MFSHIPLPDNSKNGGAVLNAMQSLNEIQKGTESNKLLKSQNKYADYKNRADVNLVEQQGKGAAIQALTNPLLWATPEGRDMAKTILKSLSSDTSGVTDQSLPKPGPDSNALMNMFTKMTGLGGGGNSGSGSGGMPTPNSGGGNPVSTTTAQNATNPVANPTNNPASGANTPANNLIKQGAGESGLQVNNPATALEAGGKGLETAVTGQQENENSQLNEAQVKANNGARLATNLRQMAHAFHAAYKDAHYKGARLGTVPSEGMKAGPTFIGQDLSKDQLADRYSNLMISTLGPSLQQNSSTHVTDSNYDLASRLKLARPLDEGAEAAMYHSTLATADRLGEEQNFINQFTKNNPDATGTEREAMWNSYNQQLPPYDFDNFNPLPKNNGQWRQFTSQEALKKYRKDGEFVASKPKETGSTSAKNEPIEPSNESISPAAKVLSKKIELPNTVKDSQSFKAWYAKQDKMTQQAAMLRWGKKKKAA